MRSQESLSKGGCWPHYWPGEPEQGGCWPHFPPEAHGHCELTGITAPTALQKGLKGRVSEVQRGQDGRPGTQPSLHIHNAKTQKQNHQLTILGDNNCVLGPSWIILFYTKNTSIHIPQISKLLRTTVRTQLPSKANK